MLIREVVDTIRTQLHPGPADQARFTAGDDRAEDIWAAVFQQPSEPDIDRLVVVYNAQHLPDWAPLRRWLNRGRRALPRNYLILVSSQADFVDKRGTPVPEHLELIRKKGRAVRCGRPNAADAIRWARRRAPVTEQVADYLLARVGGDLYQAAAVLDKLRMFDASRATTAVIDGLTRPVPADTLVDLLIRDDKPGALRAAEGLPARDLLAALALLDSRLDILEQLSAAARGVMPARPAGTLNPFLVRQYRTAARRYDPRRCAYARRLLAVCDSTVRRGTIDGVPEVLIALW